MFTFHSFWKLVLLWCISLHNVKARLHPRSTNASTSITSAVATTACDFCIIEATGGVQLIYWEPDDAGSPSNITYNEAQPYTQVENGFTFTSPSVYVVYSQLRATPTCNTNVLETIGPSFAAYTLGYSSSFLAYGILEIPGPGCTESVIAGGFHTIDFSSLYYNPIVPTTSSKPGCPPWVNPRVSMATGLQDVDPSWGSCQPFFAGAYDPPSVLKKQSRLAPPLVAGAGPVTDAGPVATVIPAQAPAAPTPDTPAPTPAADPGNNGPPPNPPSGNSQNPGPVNSPHPPQPAPAPADPGNAPANLPAASPFNPQNNPQNAPANTPPADPVSPPANPPAAPKADPINAPANAAAQSNPNPQNAPPNPAAAPPADPAKAPANNPVAAPPANPQNNPGYPAAAPPADPKTNTGAHHGAPVAGPANAPGNQPATPANNPQNAPANPAQPPVAPNATPGNGGNTSPNKPAQPQANPNNPVEAGAAAPEGGGNSAPSDPTQLQIIPNNPPAKAGDPAPKGPTQLQAIPINPPPQAPAQPQNNLNILAASGGNATPSDPNQLHNLPNNPSNGGNPTPPTPGQPQNNINSPPQGGIGNPAPAEPGQPQNNVNTPPQGDNGNPAPADPVQPQNNVNAPPVGGNGNPAQPTAINNNPPQAGGKTTPANPNNPQEVGSTSNVAEPAAGPAVALPVATAPAPVQLGTTQPLSVAGKAVQKAPDGGLLVGGQSIAQGSQATVAGSIISVGSSHVVISSSTYALPTAAATTPVTLGAPAPLSIGGQAAQYAPNGNLLVGSQTVAQGSQAAISGSVVSVGSSNLNIDGSNFALPVPIAAARFDTPAPPAIGGQPVQQAPSGGVIIAGQTVAQGSQATVQGSVVSVGSSNLVVGDSTYALPLATPAPPLVGGQSVQQAPGGGIIIGSQTIAQGSQATVQGAVVSVGSSNLVVGGSTYALPVPTAATPLEVPATIAIDGAAVQQLSKGGVVVAGQILTPGTLTTISGNVVSVGSDNIVLGGTTYSLPNVAGSAPLQTPAPLMIGGNTMQQASNGGLIIGGQTLTSGAHTTISGSSISIGASAVVVDGTTQTFLSGYTTTAGAVPSHEIVLTQGAIVTEGGKIVTYSGPAVSGFVEGKSELVVGTHTLQLVPSMTASASEKAALGGLILSALESNGSFGAASSSLGYTLTGSAGLGSLPTVNSTPAAEAGSTSLSGCWLFGRVFVAVAYIACLGIITH